MQRHEQALATLRRLEMSPEAAHTLADLAAASLLAEDAEKATAYCVEGLRASANVDSAPAESSLMVLRGIAAAQAGDYARGQEAFADALGVHQRVGALRHEASNLLWQARLASRDSDHHSAALYHAERVDALRLIGSADDVAQALRLAAVAACRGGRLSDARRLAGEEARLRAASGDGREEARARLLIASAEATTGELSAARSTLGLALGKANDDATRALCLTGFGVVAQVTGLLPEAATLMAASIAWRRGNDEESGDAVVGLYAEVATATLAAVQEAMSAGAFGRATAQGDAMDLPTAAAYARQRGLV